MGLNCFSKKMLNLIIRFAGYTGEEFFSSEIYTLGNQICK
jgi:hypothetical protein